MSVQEDGSKKQNASCVRWCGSQNKEGVQVEETSSLCEMTLAMELTSESNASIEFAKQQVVNLGGSSYIKKEKWKSRETG